jgi:hypothetical protein
MATKDRSVYFNARIIAFPGPQWNGYQNGGQTSVLIKLVRTTTGVSNPNWRQQILDKQSATTPYSGTFQTLEAVAGSIWYTAGEPQGTCSLNPFPVYRFESRGDHAAYEAAITNWFNWAVNPSYAGIAYNRALAKFLSEVRKVEVQVSSPTILAELHKTLAMIRRPAQGLSNILRSYVNQVKKAKRRNPREWKKNLSSLYLEYTFGVKPLMMDIEDGYKAYQKCLDKTDVALVSGVGIVEGDVGTNAYYTAYPTYGWAPPYLITNQRTEKVGCKIRGCVSRKMEGQSWGNASLFGFQFKEFIPTAWEILPWSFLVDYFTNIGDIITASVANTGSVRWANVSAWSNQILLVTAQETKNNPFNSGCLVGYGGRSTAKFVTRKFNRYAQSTFGLPSLSFEIPGKPAQWANMTALFAQVASGVHPQRFR